jgi:sugar lactone lactonase YvrE
MYHTDSGRRTVYRFEMSAIGELGARTPFLTFPLGWGAPDGMTVDREGHLWIAHWDGGRISRFSPSGDQIFECMLPASQITNCAFAGDKLDRLFVTSAAIGKPDEPLAGALFEVDPQGHAGLAPRLFAG